MVSLRGWLLVVRKPLYFFPLPTKKPSLPPQPLTGLFSFSKALWASTTFNMESFAKQRPKTWNIEQYPTNATWQGHHSLYHKRKNKDAHLSKSLQKWMDLAFAEIWPILVNVCSMCGYWVVSFKTWPMPLT